MTADATPNTKPPLILIPGLTCTAALWAPQVADLSRFYTITIADHTRASTMAQIAKGILAAAPPTFALAGLSMGGYISFEIMRLAPERVTKLALLDTKANLDPPERAAERRLLIEEARRNSMHAIMKKFLPMFIHPTRMTDTRLVALVKKMGADTGPDVFARQQEAILSRPDSRPTLAKIACPTLVLCGRQDILTLLSEHEAMALKIPGAHLEVIEDCGHLSTLERPTQVNAALRRWLRA
jgi:pimeloyl-ACP methyl ester carboxylesterase